MNSPFLIGERLNVTGSSAFAGALRLRDWTTVRRLAAEQLRSGAQALDICLTGSGEDEVDVTREFYTECRLNIPVFIDSVNPEVMEAAVQTHPHITALNSANLAKGDEAFQRACQLAAKCNVSLVCGCIDEDGVAVSAVRKLSTIERLLTLSAPHLTPESIILDLLALPIRTLPDSLAESVKAVREVKLRFPAAKTLLAISNVSYSLPLPDRAKIENEFFQRSADAGLDFAIVNTARLRVEVH